MKSLLASLRRLWRHLFPPPLRGPDAETWVKWGRPRYWQDRT